MDTEQRFGEVVSKYSRGQAIKDGELVDVSSDARDAGIVFPVAVTLAVWEDCCEWTDKDQEASKYPQDVQGRLWDVVWMLRCAISRSGHGSSDLAYTISRIPRPGHGRARLVRLKAVVGPGDNAEPVITIMQPDED